MCLHWNIRQRKVFEMKMLIDIWLNYSLKYLGINVPFSWKPSGNRRVNTLVGEDTPVPGSSSKANLSLWNSQTLTSVYQLRGTMVLDWNVPAILKPHTEQRVNLSKNLSKNFESTKLFECAVYQPEPKINARSCRLFLCGLIEMVRTSTCAIWAMVNFPGIGLLLWLL